jgi:polyhydroxyalkanoate synthase subunit PhaC
MADLAAATKPDRAKSGFDKLIHASIARMTGGVSPLALNQAYTDWAWHLRVSPDKQMELLRDAAAAWLCFLFYCLRAGQVADCPLCVEPLPQDKRFDGAAWKRWPFNLFSQGFLLTEHWWHRATTGVAGVSKHHEDVVEFVARQLLDSISPKNFAFTNPEVIAETIKQRGMNFIRGAVNFWQDWQGLVTRQKPAGTEAFQIGRDVAVTKGKVVYRNRLIELIQYAPATAHVHPEPILIVPAWIMKYYILDLSPGNSLVRYLTENCYTVFMISWKNPASEDGGLGMEDYRQLGVMAALDAVSSIIPERAIHAAGYCLGGTLLTIAAAAMGRDGDTRLKSMTLFAAQTNFTEAGELTLFIDEAQVHFFADTTRLPYRMHSEYLRRFFLSNDLAECRCKVFGRAVSLRDIRCAHFRG